MKWDLFISHASEDKVSFVEPLAHALQSIGYRVWYDDFSLQPGSSIRRSIDDGLAQSAAGLVVLSPNFFRKEWPQRELDALTAQQIGDGKKVFPIWLDVVRDDVAHASPLLADRAAILASLGLKRVTEKIKQVLPVLSDSAVDSVIEMFFVNDSDTQRLLLRKSLLNFSKLVAYFNAYEHQLDVASPKQEDDDDADDAFGETMETWHREARQRYDLPVNGYLEPTGAVVSQEAVQDIETRLEAWCSGSLGQRASAELFYDLDEYLNADYLFILYSLPNFSVSPAQRQRLEESIARIGARRCGGRKVPWPDLYRRVLHSILR